PAGVINIVTGAKDALHKVLAEHDDVDAVWYVGNQAGGAEVERASAGNMKRTWAEWDARDWMDPKQGEGQEFLREATQVKNIWIPYGEETYAAAAEISSENRRRIRGSTASRASGCHCTPS